MSGIRYAIITGGSSGLGLAFARKLAAEGYVPVLVARRQKLLDDAVSALARDGHAALAFAGDVVSPESLTAVADRVKHDCGSVDLLVLNAGSVTVKLLADYTDWQELRNDIDVDLWGTILSARVFLPLLQPGARIIMISSALGLLGAAGYTTYCAAKAGVINFAEALRRELLTRGITVHVACPADIDTPQYAAEQKAMPAWMTAGASARKSLISPDDCAAKILSCVRRNCFLITTSPDIALLSLLQRLLPWRAVTAILDRTLPRPK